MENQQMPTKKIALNYGLILGLISILFHVILFALGKHLDQDWKMSVLSIAITAVVTVLGIKKFKESNNGLLSLGQGLKTGIAIVMISAVVYIIYTMIFMFVISPESAEHALEIARQKLMENPSMTDEIIEQSLEMQKKFSAPAFLIPIMLIMSLFIGFVISLIATLIMKKTDEEVTSI